MEESFCFAEFSPWKVETSLCPVGSIPTAPPEARHCLRTARSLPRKAVSVQEILACCYFSWKPKIALGNRCLFSPLPFGFTAVRALTIFKYLKMLSARVSFLGWVSSVPPSGPPTAELPHPSLSPPRARSGKGMVAATPGLELSAVLGCTSSALCCQGPGWLRSGPESVRERLGIPLHLTPEGPPRFLLWAVCSSSDWDGGPGCSWKLWVPDGHSRWRVLSDHMQPTPSLPRPGPPSW